MRERERELYHKNTPPYMQQQLPQGGSPKHIRKYRPRPNLPLLAGEIQ